MTTLLLDVGNSRLKWGIAEDGRIRRTGRISQQKILEQGLNALATRLPRRVDVATMSNVAGASRATRLSGFLAAHFDVDLQIARSTKKGWGVENGYRQPRKLGVDRWVAMVAAWAELQSACLVVDAGTALTIDALDDTGRHLGGQIIAGSETMRAALSAATSDLPHVKSAARHGQVGLDMFATTTAAAIREGTHNAVTGAIERAIQGMLAGGFDPAIVLTGGGASRILDSLEHEALDRPNLVLQGLLHMLENPR